MISNELLVAQAYGAAKLLHQLMIEALNPPDFPQEPYRPTKKEIARYKDVLRTTINRRMKNIEFVQNKHPIIEYFCSVFEIDQKKLCDKILENNKIPVSILKREQSLM